jgi:hypothetical protein
MVSQQTAVCSFVNAQPNLIGRPLVRLINVSLSGLVELNRSAVGKNELPLGSAATPASLLTAERFRSNASSPAPHVAAHVVLAHAPFPHCALETPLLRSVAAS